MQDLGCNCWKQATQQTWDNSKKWIIKGLDNFTEANFVNGNSNKESLDTTLGLGNHQFTHCQFLFNSVTCLAWGLFRFLANSRIH